MANDVIESETEDTRSDYESSEDDNVLVKRQRVDEPFSGVGFGGQFDDGGLSEAQALLTSSA